MPTYDVAAESTAPPAAVWKLLVDPQSWFAYEGVENPHLSGYRATVELHELRGGGTRIRWHGGYSARRGTGWFLQWYLRRFMQRMATGLAQHAARVS